MKTAKFMKQHGWTLSESVRVSVRTHFLILLAWLVCSCTYAQDRNNRRKDDMNDDKKQAALWYEAFSKNDPAILDRILSENWVDIPSAPGQPSGPEAGKTLLAMLTTTFPELNL